MRNLTLLTDFYELTMANSFFVNNKNEIASFDLFFRNIPDRGGYAIMAGLAQVIQYINELTFSDEDINFLRSKNIFDEGFLNYLKNFKFTSSLYAIKEGTPIFPKEPILRVTGPLIECQLIETMLLLTINHQSLIATKTRRIVHAAQGRTIMEFGSRRAQGYDGANYGARAAYISGAIGTSNTFADLKFEIPALGTMAHSYVQSFKSEYEAFLTYAKTYQNDTLLLVDTYSTLESGIPNAIKVAKEYLEPNGYRLKGIRIDSGDLAYLSKEARKMLDDAGLTDCKITASSSLDEYIIEDLIHQGAAIDNFGVGERLITSKTESVFGGVYKLAALKENGNWIPKMKKSDNIEKMTIPGNKMLYRLYDKNNKAIADVITLEDEIIDESKPYLLFDPHFPYKQKTVTNFRAVKLLEPIFIEGKQVYFSPPLKEIRKFADEQFMTLWVEMKRFESPHKYYVDYSKKLWDLKQNMLNKMKDKF